MPPEKPTTGIDVVLGLAQDFATEAEARRSFERAVLAGQERLEERLEEIERLLRPLQETATHALEAQAEERRAQADRLRAERERLQNPPTSRLDRMILLLEKSIDRVTGDSRTLLISVGLISALLLVALGWSKADILAALSTLLSSCAGGAP